MRRVVVDELNRDVAKVIIPSFQLEKWIFIYAGNFNQKPGVGDVLLVVAGGGRRRTAIVNNI